MQTLSQPLIVTFASPKGGVGKSTTCLALAGALAARGYPVHILDLDQTQTLWLWYSEHRPAIANLTVEAVPESAFWDAIKANYAKRTGFIFIDAAGALTEVMVHAATVAHLTITPAKLSPPDIREAVRLNRRILEAARHAEKIANHRIVLNEVSALLPGYQNHALAELDRIGLQRFATLMHTRAPYAEALSTGQPPHFADQSRPPVRKAVSEIDALLAEMFDVLGLTQQEKVAA
jgi:chromosome partitioning protein